jgi:hypothetical protein
LQKTCRRCGGKRHADISWRWPSADRIKKPA